ncbi:MAG: hypothetical protein JXC32_07110 [Anaerolineae bacterium]|nr:hypothetical protein [Anaerolineae bacterium]
MTKWISEWVVFSMLLVLGGGLLFVLWAIWPMLPQRLPNQVLANLNVEGLLAMGTLLIFVLGFGKLVFAK